MSLKNGPTDFENFKISFPTDKILLVTLTRTQKLNAIDLPTSKSLASIWTQFDLDASLWVGIITGSGRSFCVGADLQEWNALNLRGETNSMDAPGLAGLPRRSGKKPIIAAVNGLCMGGGFEMVANCDVVVAARDAVFALPEVKRGIVPVAGCLPRLTRTLGLQRTSDLVLTGRRVSGSLRADWGLVTRLVERGEDVVAAAIGVAEEMCGNSPDALIVGRAGIRMAWEDGSVEGAVSKLAEGLYPQLVQGENFKDGIKAFVEKRDPVWVNSKL